MTVPSIVMRSAVFPLLVCFLLSCATAQKLIGELSTLEHDVAGTVFAIDKRTFEVRNFVYDGLGPRAFFWVGTGRTPNADGFAIPVSVGVNPPCGTQRLPAFNGDTVRVELPASMTIDDIGHLSVWCETAFVNFGDVAITDASRAGVPDPTGPAVCSSEGTFPVQDGYNCENLNEFYQVRWKVNGTNINFELVGKVKPGYYMGFGVSGMENRTGMVGSDVVIATEGKSGIQAEDYYMSARGQCANGAGVCPDTASAPASGQNSITGVTGTRTKDALMVRYTRPVAASDPVVDKAFKIGANESTYLSWAIGPFNNDSNIPQIHRGEMAIPLEDVFFQFGRPVKDNCMTPIVAMDEKEETKIVPWTRPTISNVTDITARIGPSAGNRGVAGITSGSSWGIAWYMSPTGSTGQDVLIPAIAVERGKTYTFRVFGGDNSTESAMHHPLYITNDTDGGLATKMPISRASEQIFAGVNVTTRDPDGAITAFNPTAMGKLCNFIQKPSVTDVDTVESFEDYYKQLDTSCANEIQQNQAGVLRWTVPLDAPDLLYYQCVTHRDLGYKLVVFDEGQVDEQRLRLESGGGSASCTVTFKGKVQSFSGCADVTSNFRVLWTLGEDTIDTLFMAKTTSGWAGFSWGNSGMVGSNAVIAYKLADGTAGIDDYFLSGRSSQAVQPAGRQNLTNSEVEIDGDTIAARFTRPLSGSGIKPVTNGLTDLIWAIGPESPSSTSLSVHTLRGTFSVDLSTTGGQKGKASGGSKQALFLAHGAMMGIAWIVLIPLAVIAMRFFKAMNPITFQVHRGLAGLSVIVILISFIMGVAQGSHTNSRHLGLGVVITLLALWQAVNGALRPQKETPSRKPWFWAHAYSGRTAVVLAIINVFFGIDLFREVFGQSPLPLFWRIIAGVIVGVLLGLVVTLSAFPGKFPVTEQGPLLPHERSGSGATETEM